MNAQTIAVGLAALAITTVPVAPARADASAPTGWNGKCYTNWHTSKAVNMWCDGKGPERYGVSVLCTQGRKTYQYNSAEHPWFGDRRGATAACRRGTVTTWWAYPVG